MKRAMKNSGVPWLGDVPAEWEVVPLYKIVHQVKTPNEGMVEKNLLSLSYGRIVRKDMETASGLVPESYAGYNRIEPDDVVLRLTDLQNDQRSLRVGLSHERGIVTSAYLTIRPTEDCSPDYLAYAIKVFDFRKGFYGIGSGVRQSLKFGEVKKIAVPLPSLPEQRRIAAFLDGAVAKIDGIRAGIQREIERLGDYRKSLVAEAVTGKRNSDSSDSLANARQKRNVSGASDKSEFEKRPMKSSGIPWLGDVPAEWEFRKIGALYEERSQKVSEREYPALSVSKLGVVPQLEHVAKSNDVDNRKLVRKGDFAINSRSDRRGACGIANQDGSVSLINIVLKPKTSMEPAYFDWLFHSSLFADEFYKWGSGIDADVWSTRWMMMKKITIPIPPLPEQREIAAFLDKAMSQIDAAVEARKGQLEKLDALKRTVIAETVTGKRNSNSSDCLANARRNKERRSVSGALDESEFEKKGQAQ